MALKNRGLICMKMWWKNFSNCFWKDFLSGKSCFKIFVFFIVLVMKAKVNRFITINNEWYSHNSMSTISTSVFIINCRDTTPWTLTLIKTKLDVEICLLSLLVFDLVYCQLSLKWSESKYEVKHAISALTHLSSTSWGATQSVSAR